MNTKGTSKIMRKLLGQPAATATDSPADTLSLESPHLRPSASQNTTYAAGAPIACLERSADGKRAVIAGPKVFKILKVEGSRITEEADLRASIASYATNHDLSSATPEQLNIRAVTWSQKGLESRIITASGNGNITVYDLNRLGGALEVLRLQEHSRQIHRLAVSPWGPDLLLCASQDGSVKKFDLREPGAGAIVFKCNADAVRDVKWCPKAAFQFACSTDAGVIQKWDWRRPAAPILRIGAHTSSCLSISWHPDGSHLVSGGTDQVCNVWDFSDTADRNQKPRFSFTTPAPVRKVAWRPACWSATAHGKRAAQITVAYDDSNKSKNQTSHVHIWDLARPSMPFKEIEQWDSAPTTMLWNTRDLLWTVDKEGRFTQTDAAFVPKLLDRRSLSNFSFSPAGDLLMLLEQRAAPRRARPPLPSPDISPSIKHDGVAPLLSVSRSDSEEDVVGSFLGPRVPKSHRRRNSTRSNHQPLSTTPPSINGANDIVMSLDAAIKVTGVYKPQQVMAIGHAPSTTKRALYQYLSNRYLLRLAGSSTVSARAPANIRTSSIMEFYARTAESVGQYRLAQTWRLLGFTVNLLLTRRAEHHRKSRLMVQKPAPSGEETKDALSPSRPRTARGEETPRRYPRAQTTMDSPKHIGAVHFPGEDIESTSNVATPLVRPVHNSIAQETQEAMQTPLVIENDVLNLPESVLSSTPSPIPVPGAKQTEDHTSSSIEGYDFYGMESFRPSVDFVAPPKKQPLRLDYPGLQNTTRIQPQRHDSNESFQMFSTSNDSHNGKFMSSSDSDAHSAMEGRALRERVSSWENSPEEHLGHRPSVDSSVEPHSQSSQAGHITPGSHEILSGIPNELPLRPNSPPIFRIQEASVPLVNKTPAKSVREEPVSPTTAERTSGDPNIIESDFLPWPNDPDFLIHPIDPAVLVQRQITFEAQTGSLTAAIMVLLLRNLLPSSAIDGLQASAILRQYQHRLVGMKLFTEAAMLRNLCVPTYPAVFAAAQENINVGYFCTDCHKPIENDPLIPQSEWRCPRCRQCVNACAICNSRDVDETVIDYEEGQTSDAIWWLCPGCGHGGHSVCMQAWHSGLEFQEGDRISGGCCPLEGCLHPCLPGKWRDKRAAEKEAIRSKEMDLAVKQSSRNGSRKSIRSSGPVRRDAREVNQSNAVEGVRVALGFNGERGLERRKSVKLVAPGEE